MTLPFSDEFEAKLKENIQGGRLSMLKGQQDHPQFFCCISGNTVGVDKDPVPVISVDNRVICQGVDITLDYSRSWSPTDTLAGQAWQIDWGDLDIDNGNFPNPRNAAAETHTKVGGYATTGFFYITFWCRDSSGATAQTRIQVYVVDCSVAPEELPFILPRYMALGGFILGGGTAVYYAEEDPELEEANPTWTGLDNGDHTAAEIQDLKSELTTYGEETLYMVDRDGIWAHPLPPDSGLGTWTLKQSDDQIITAAGLNPADYSVERLRNLAISVERDGWQWMSWYCYELGPMGNSVEGYYGVASTRDGWDTIEDSVWLVHCIQAAPGTDQGIRGGFVAVDQHSDGMVVYASGSVARELLVTEESNLWKSTDGGATWSEVDSLPTYSYWTPIHKPYADNDTVYWADHQRMRVSYSGGGSFATAESVLGDFNTVVLLKGPLDRTDLVNIQRHTSLYEWTPGTGLVKFGNSFPVGIALDNLVLARDNSSQVTKWLWAGGQVANGQIWRNRDTAQDDRKGNWTAGYVYVIGTIETEEHL